MNSLTVRPSFICQPRSSSTILGSCRPKKLFSLVRFPRKSETNKGRLASRFEAYDSSSKNDATNSNGSSNDSNSKPPNGSLVFFYLRISFEVRSFCVIMDDNIVQ